MTSACHRLRGASPELVRVLRRTRRRSRTCPGAPGPSAGRRSRLPGPSDSTCGPIDVAGPAVDVLHRLEQELADVLGQRLACPRRTCRGGLRRAAVSPSGTTGSADAHGNQSNAVVVGHRRVRPGRRRAGTRAGNAAPTCRASRRTSSASCRACRVDERVHVVLDDVVALPVRPVRAAALGVRERVAGDVGGAVADPAQRERLLLGTRLARARLRDRVSVAFDVGLQRVLVERVARTGRSSGSGTCPTRRTRCPRSRPASRWSSARRCPPSGATRPAADSSSKRPPTQRLDLADLAEHPAGDAVGQLVPARRGTGAIHVSHCSTNALSATSHVAERELDQLQQALAEVALEVGQEEEQVGAERPRGEVVAVVVAGREQLARLGRVSGEPGRARPLELSIVSAAAWMWTYQLGIRRLPGIGCGIVAAAFRRWPPRPEMYSSADSNMPSMIRRREPDVLQVLEACPAASRSGRARRGCSRTRGPARLASSGPSFGPALASPRAA